MRKGHRPQPDKKVPCRNCGGDFPHTGQCLAKDKQRNYCKKTNHFKSVCRSFKKRESVKEIKPERAHQTTNASDSDNDCDYCYTIKFEQVIGTIGRKTLSTSVAINQVKCAMLIDPGASVRKAYSTDSEAVVIDFNLCISTLNHGIFSTHINLKGFFFILIIIKVNLTFLSLSPATPNAFLTNQTVGISI